VSDSARIAIDHTFTDEALLRQALTHRSYGVPHNERLEFIGDAILGCVIALALFERFPDLPEGKLSRIRAHLVRKETLAVIAIRLGIGELLRIGNMSTKGGGAYSESMVADSLEAVFGAVFIDAGFEAARKAIFAAYGDLLRDADPIALGKDPKTHLQEVLHKKRLVEPQYVVVAVTGKAPSEKFSVECRIPDLAIVASGVGNSRRAAEQDAATAALAAVTSQKGTRLRG
jgi:ribonuclease-3